MIQIANGNPFHSTRDIKVRQVLSQNPYGARLKLSGQALVDNTFINVSPDQPLVMEMTVERGLSEYAYQNLQVVVMPVCYGDPDITYTLTDGDTITFSVYFTNPCSDIVLVDPEEGWVIQRRNLSSTTNQEADVGKKQRVLM